MEEFVITLTSPTGTSTETAYTRSTAEGIKERWESQGPQWTAEIAPVQRAPKAA